MNDTPGYDETPDEDMDVGPAPKHSLLELGKTKFEPWHHPRKQWVRVQQWCWASRKLIRQLGLTAADPFRYLTLPGNEMLDVRALSDVCKDAGTKLRFLGFNSVGPRTPAQNELNVSQNEVRGHEAVDPFSRVLERRLETVTNPGSQEHAAARELGPFHAINIDLCDSIAFRDLDDRKGSGLGVLAQLLQLQLATTEPWLLFVTTQASPDLISAKNQAGFMDAITANTSISEDFKAELAGLVSSTADQLDARLGDAWNGQDPDFLRLFCTGLGKWLLRVLGGTQPTRKLTLLNSCYYRVGSVGPNMLSLVFRCDTKAQRLNDRDGILPPQAVTADADMDDFSEVQAAIAMAQEIAKAADLDALIHSNKELAEKLVGQAGRLMASARFSQDAYSTWANDQLAQFTPEVPVPA